MATDSTNLPQSAHNNDASEHDFSAEVVQLAAAEAPAGGQAPANTQSPNVQAAVIPGVPNGEVQVQIPAGETVVRVQVAPGETIDLPFDGAMAAKFGEQGNLAIKLGDQTIILLGYAEANQQAGVTVKDDKGQAIDVATVVAQTDPNLDIQTAAGPAAGQGGQGGHLFFGFNGAGGLGGFNELGTINQTELQYQQISPDEKILIQGEAAPQLMSVSVENGGIVNEDDFHHSRSEAEIGRANYIYNDPDNPASSGLLAQLQGNGNFSNVSFGYYNYRGGNDAYDTADHEDGSQVPGQSDNNNGIDQDREPLSSRSTLTVNFAGSVPGSVTFDHNGATPVIDQLKSENLTSGGHALQYILLPATAGHGESIVAYYNDGEGDYQHQVIVFALEIEEASGATAVSQFHIDFTIFGTLDNPQGVADPALNAGGIGDGVFNLDTIFFLNNAAGGFAQAPSGTLVFHDYDDKPELGYFNYSQGEGDATDTAVSYQPANLTIGIDETHGHQSTAYNADLKTLDPSGSLHQGASQTTDDTCMSSDIANGYLKDVVAGGAGSTDLATNIAAVLGHIDASFFNKSGDQTSGLNVFMGGAQTWLDVSFGADGPAQANLQAGRTLFAHDGVANASAFELYLQAGNGKAGIDSSLTNLTITYVDSQGVSHNLTVTAYQLDANTIIGVSAPAGDGTRGEGQEGAAGVAGGIPVFMLHLDPQSGELTLVQYHQINDLDADGNPTDLMHLTTADGSQLVHFQATDYDGDHVSAPLEITFTDDSPVAHADSLTLGAGVFTPVTGNVITAAGEDDASGKDHKGVDGAIVTSAQGTGADTPVGTNTVIEGQYGSLTINSDGSYSYTRDPSKGGGGHDDVFHYTLTDGDKDTSSTTLTIHITDSPVTVTEPNPDVALGVTQVLESGLQPDGTLHDGTSNVAHGVITVSAPDGVATITVGGQEIDLGNPGATPAIVSAEGSLQITGWDPATGELSYTYTLQHSTNGDTTTDSFAVDVVDTDGDHNPASSLVISIVDDVPTANADTASVNSGYKLDVDATNGVEKNDVFGADGKAASSVVGVTTGSDTTSDVSGNVGTVIHGTYGDLTLNDDGSYSYQAKPNVSGVDHFVYTIQDGDGDKSTTTLDITVNKVAPDAASGEVTVDEAAIDPFKTGKDVASGNVFGSNWLSNAETAQGDLHLPAGVTVQNPGTFVLDYGTLVVKADGTYTYTLTSNDPNHPASGTDTIFGADIKQLTIVDSHGNTNTATISIDIKDDVPTAHDDAALIVSGGKLDVPALLGVELNDVFGADGKSGKGVIGVTTGSDTSSAVTTGVGTVIHGTYGDLTLNADGSYSYQAKPNVGGTDHFVYTIQDGDGDTSTASLDIVVKQIAPDARPDKLTVDEAALDTTITGKDVAAGSVIGSNPDSTKETAQGSLHLGFGVQVQNPGTFVLTYGTLVVKQDGSYTYTLTSNDPNHPASGTDTINGADSKLITIVDALGNTNTTTISISIKDDVPTAHADTGAVNSGYQLNVDAAHGVELNDVFGADGKSGKGVVGVTTGSDTSTAVTTGVGSVIHGAYGDLTLNDDGSYSYQAKPNVGGVDHFVYTIKDGDGDLSTTTLDITVTKVAPAAASGEVTVDEAAIDPFQTGKDVAAGNVFGSNWLSNAETAQGDLHLPAGVSVQNPGTFVLDYGTLVVKADGTYTYTLTSNDPNHPASGTDTIFGADIKQLTIVDTHGNTNTATISIDIKDDVPTANGDVNFTVSGGKIDLAAGFNVEWNDVFGADGKDHGKGVVGVTTGSDTSSAVTSGVGTVIHGAYGDLTLNADGSYSYQAKTNVGGTDHFVYTVQDGDGDTSTTTLDIVVTQLTPSARPDTLTVDEAALDATITGKDVAAGSITGSNPSSTKETAQGDLHLGFGVQVQNPGTFVLTYGTLVVKQDGSYTYTLTSNDPNHPNAGTDTINGADSKTITIVDALGNTNTTTISVNIKDDVPSAHDDKGAVNSGDTLQVNAANGVEKNDVFGADGKDSGGGVVGVATGQNVNSAVSGNVGTVIHGTYGDLTLFADGHYTYAAKPNASGTDHFVYTIQDGDGDLSTAHLDIDVTKVAPTAANGSLTVYESALDLTKDPADLAAGTVTGTDPTSTGETAQAKLALASGVTVQTTGTFNLTYGVLKVDSDGTYTYTLTKNVLNPTADDGSKLINGIDSKVITIVDSHGNTSTVTISVNAWDDRPVLVADNGSVFNSLNHQTESGNVLTGGVSHVGADNLGADGGIVFQAQLKGAASQTAVASGSNGSVIHGAYGDLTLHQDGSYTYTQTKAAPTNVTAETFNYSVKDGDGDTASTTLTINVAHAPTIGSTDGASVVSIQNLSLTNDPNGSTSVGNYLLNTNVEGHAINPSLVNGVNPSNLTMNVGSDVTVTFEREGAGYHNMVGVYAYDDKGNVIPGSAHFIWLDASQVNQNVLHNGLVTDFLGNSQQMTADLGNYPAGTKLGFFLVVDGANNSTDVNTIKNVPGVTTGNDQANDLSHINAVTSITFDKNGDGHITVNGTQLSSNVIFSSNSSWNTYTGESGVNGGQHVLSGVSNPADGNLYIGFEDQNLKASDLDYNDVVFGVNLGSQNISKIDPQIYNPNIVLTDIDNDIHQVTIATTGFLSGDSLNHLTSHDGFSVSTTMINGQYSVTITDTGSHTASEWQSFVNSIDFSSTSQVDGQRNLQYTVTDVSGYSSSTTAHVTVSAVHQESVSQMDNDTTGLLHTNNHNGHNVTWGGGDDTVYLDQNLISKDGILDMGGGNNTVHIGANGLNITSSDTDHLKNVDHIDMTGYNGGNNNTATLSYNDVFGMTDSNHTLKIDADNGDTVNLKNDGSHNWSAVPGGADANGYLHYQAGSGASAVTVLIEDHTNVHIVS